MIEFFKIVTVVGEVWAIFIFAAVIIVFLIIQHKWHYAVFVVSVILATEVSVLLIKQLTALPRPPEILHLVTVSGFSFPSGHAAVTAALFGALWYIYFLTLPRLSSKAFLTVLVVTVVTLVAASRLVLGVHYFPDVVAGIAIAAIWLSIGIVSLKFNTIYYTKISSKNSPHIL